MILYHGGYSAIETPRIITGGFAKDFGDGLYCTELKEQAIRWSRRYTTPIVTLFDYKSNATLKQLHFPTMSEVWLDFIVNCRNHIPHDYDIVSGPMADDQIYNYISDYINQRTILGISQIQVSHSSNQFLYVKCVKLFNLYWK